jgi:hypothetical protein
VGAFVGAAVSALRMGAMDDGRVHELLKSAAERFA